MCKRLSHPYELQIADYVHFAPGIMVCTRANNNVHILCVYLTAERRRSVKLFLIELSIHGIQYHHILEGSAEEVLNLKAINSFKTCY